VWVFALAISGCTALSSGEREIDVFPQPSTAMFDLNDVSVLIPLPVSVNEQGLLLKGVDDGGKGALLPRAFFDEFPLLTFSEEFATIVYDELLSVQGIRIDPCFAKDAEGSDCVPQVRLIMQPGVANGFSFDLVYHLFYDLTEEEFASLVADLAAWKDHSPADTAGLPLSVHPGLQESGIDSDFANELFGIILSYAGSGNLTRIASASVGLAPAAADPDAPEGTPRDFHRTWAFAARDVANGVLVTATTIPDTLTERQILTDRTIEVAGQPFGPADTEGATLEPSFIAPHAVTPLLGNMAEVQGMMEEEVLAAVGGAVRADNPLLENAHSLDCAGCHVADKAVRAASFYRGVDYGTHEDRFDTSGFDARLTTGFLNDFGSVRAFGYFGFEPAIIQRTVNESIHVARLVNSSGWGLE